MERRSLCTIALAGTILLLATREASARETATLVSPGLIMSTWSTSNQRFMAGGELSVIHRDQVWHGWGGFVQTEWAVPTRDEPLAHPSFHLSAGPEVSSYLWGAELGIDYRSGDGDRIGRSLGLRFAPFVSLSLVYVSVSVSVLPVLADDRPGREPYGVLMGATMGIKLPFNVAGQINANHYCPHC